MGQSASPEIELASFAHPILINLPERTERLADSLAELSTATGRPVVVDRDVHLIRPTRFTEPAGFANPGFRSNLHAHLQAARWARESEWERVAVFEDDLACNPLFATWAPRLLAQLVERPWHLANLGYLDEWGEAPVEPDVPLPDSVAASPPRGIGWARFAGRTNGAHAYLLHRRAYDDWIDHLETVLEGRPGDALQGPMPSDGAINTFFWVGPDRIRLVASPNLVGTRPTRSDIDPGAIDRLPLVGGLVESARRWRRRRRPSAAINYR